MRTKIHNVYFLQIGIILSFFLLASAGVKAQDHNTIKPNVKSVYGFEVNSYTGNLYQTRQDIFIPGIGMNLDLSFTYNSDDKDENWGFGNGWTFSYNLFLNEELDDSAQLETNSNDDLPIASVGSPALVSVTAKLTTGRRYSYQLLSNSFISQSGIFNQLVANGDGTYFIRKKNGTLIKFDDPTHKKVTSIIDRNGNSFSFTYSEGVLMKITDASGRRVNLEYTNGMLTHLSTDTEPIRETFYEYDTNGNLILVTDALGEEIQYAYGADHLLTGYADKNKNPLSVSYTETNVVKKLATCKGSTSFFYNTAQLFTTVLETVNNQTQKTNYQFDEEGRLVEQNGNCCGFNVTFEYDEENNITKRTDANGNDYQYSYDKRGNRTQEIDPYGNTSFYAFDLDYNQITSFTDKKGNIISFSYNAIGNLLSTSKPEGVSETYTYYSNGLVQTMTDGVGNPPYQYSYNSNGYLTESIDPDNQSTIIEYNGVGNRTKLIDPNSYETDFEYDELSRLIKLIDDDGNETKFTLDANGNIKSIQNALGIKSYSEFDCHDRVILERDSLGNTFEYEYDVKGNLLKEIDARGFATLLDYNKLNRLETSRSALDEITDRQYDSHGNLVFLATPDGNTIQYEYDKLNRLIVATDIMGVITEITYDKNSNITSRTDGQGNTTNYEYDGLNRVVSETDPLGHSIYYEYDTNSNRTKIIDRLGNKTDYEYDEINRLALEKDALLHEKHYEYDANGNLTKIIDQLDNETTYHYNHRDQVTRVTYADGSFASYAYDEIGNQSSRRDHNGNLTSYEYDVLNRLTRRVYPEASEFEEFGYNSNSQMTEATNQHVAITMDYDPLGRLLYEDWDDQREVSYSYSTNERTREITYPNAGRIKELFDERGRLVSIADKTIDEFLIVSQNYDEGNRLTSRIFEQTQNISQWSYDANSRITSISHNPLAEFQYGYDHEGNRVYEQKNHLSSNSNSYIYDDLYRLTEHRVGQLSGDQIPNVLSSELFNHDDLGNRESYDFDDSIINYDVNELNQYSSVSTELNNTLSYDLNGNLLTGLNHTYSYDYENRLVSVDSGVTASYKFDALGRRIEKTTSEGTVQYFYDGIHVIEEQGAFGQTLATYIYGQGTDEILQMQQGSESYYYFQDALGSTVAITDSNGQLAESYSYLSYGTPSIYDNIGTEITESSISNPYLFTSRRLDNETNSYHYRNRQYSHLLGRFNQRDPLGYVDDLGLYQYAFSNPTNYTDPLGLCGSQPCSLNGVLDFFDTFGLQNSIAKSYCNFYMGNYREGSEYLASSVGRAGLTVLSFHPGLLAARFIFQGLRIASFTSKLGSAVLGTSIAIGKVSGKVYNAFTKGGKTFAQYRTSYWASRVKPTFQPIRMSNGKVFKVHIELHHRYIPQRAKWAPNWLKNNKINLQPLNTIRHGINDSYRFRFFPKEIKSTINNGNTFGY